MPLAIRQPPEVEKFLRLVRDEILDADLTDPAATITVITVLVDVARQVADIAWDACDDLTLLQATAVAVVEAWDERLAKTVR